MNVFVNSSLPVLVGASLLFASSAMAQEIGPQTGDREFSLSGTGSSSKDFDNGSFGISGDYGWYLSDRTLMGIRQSVNFADDFDGSRGRYVDELVSLPGARPEDGAPSRRYSGTSRGTRGQCRYVVPGPRR